MFQWFLKWLEKKDRKLTIRDRDGVTPYMDRYHILYNRSEKRKKKDIPFNAFLHNFIRSDEDTFHSHPWGWYFSIILKGGYWEHTPWGTHWRGPGHFRFVNCSKVRKLGDHYVPANLHWVEIPESGKTWTLFIRGEKEGDEWGFLPDLKNGVVVHWKKYLAKRLEKDNVGM